jgi:methionyl-tRNA formyltransferase
MNEQRYLVATVKPWNLSTYHRSTRSFPGSWHLIDAREELTLALIEHLTPRYSFFPHWSWLVLDSILNATECVCFHMTDLPYGRGGSPLQNLISRGARDTVMTALRMTGELDAGPVYLKRPLNLDGSAQEIYQRAAELIFEMIGEIIEHEPVPTPQQGVVTQFARRQPDQSVLPESTDPKLIYDHIRMLDAEGYPRAFCKIGPVRLEFSDAKLEADHVAARVAILPHLRGER